MHRVHRTYLRALSLLKLFSRELHNLTSHTQCRRVSIDMHDERSTQASRTGTKVAGVNESEEETYQVIHIASSGSEHRFEDESSPTSTDVP